jgi:hypothetical protein
MVGPERLTGEPQHGALFALDRRVDAAEGQIFDASRLRVKAHEKPPCLVVGRFRLDERFYRPVSPAFRRS